MVVVVIGLVVVGLSDALAKNNGDSSSTTSTKDHLTGDIIIVAAQVSTHSAAARTI